MTNFVDLLHQHTALNEKLGLDTPSLEALAAFMDRLWTENQKINLVSRKLTPEALVTDHLYDCLIGLPYLPKAKAVADLGTGGGFPVLPLALCRPETRFTLYEKSPLKCRFLETLTDLAPNIQVAGALDDKGLPQETDLVIARGFKALRIITQMTRTYHKAGGRYLLYKGRRARIDEELTEARIKPSQATIVPLNPVGDADERHLVLLGKW